MNDLKNVVKKFIGVDIGGHYHQQFRRNYS